MKTRSKKSSINTSNNRRKPLGDKTNNVSASNNMKRKNNSKVTTMRPTRKNVASENELDTKRRLSNRLKNISPDKSITNIINTSKIKDNKKLNPKINSKVTKNVPKKTNKPINEEKTGQNKENNKNKGSRNNSKVVTNENNKSIIHANKNEKTGQNLNNKNKRLRNNLKVVSNENKKSIINETETEKTASKNIEKSPKVSPEKNITKKTNKSINEEKTGQNKENNKNKGLRNNSKVVTNENNKSIIHENKNEKKVVSIENKKSIINETETEKTASKNIEKSAKISPQKNITKPELKSDDDPLKNPKNKRLLGSFKFTSPENNSDPYEFKFDPKEEPKRKQKKRTKAKIYDSVSDTSDEEDNSMKPIIKNIRKKQLPVTPFERKLRNRFIKIERKTPKKIPEKCDKNVIMPETCPKSPEKCEEKVVEIPAPTLEKTMSVVDEINEIANTFLEDDTISSPSRIDIISNLIVRKSYQPSSKVFNSTMIHETPQEMPPRSPWRVEVSAIPKKTLNFSVKNKSFTPSYTPELVTPSVKKQTTLLGFVSRQSKPDLPINLFENISASKSRKPFGDLSNSMSPIRQMSPHKKSDDSLFGFTVLSDSEDKENTPVKCKSPPKLKKLSPKLKVQNVQINEVDKNVDISLGCIPLFEDLNDIKRDEKRYSRQYTRQNIKRKRNISMKIDSDVEDSDSDTEVPVKKKQKDVLSKEEADEAERLASHYNSYFEEIENYPLCIE